MEFVPPLLSVPVFCSSLADPFWISADLRGHKGTRDTWMWHIPCIVLLVLSLSLSGDVSCCTVGVEQP